MLWGALPPLGLWVLPWPLPARGRGTQATPHRPARTHQQGPACVWTDQEVAGYVDKVTSTPTLSPLHVPLTFAASHPCDIPVVTVIENSAQPPTRAAEARPAGGEGA